jgi:hypothetical protein
MVDVITKTILIETIKESLKRFFSTLNIEKITQEERERISDALASVQRATIRTRNFIQNNGYEANEELAELWTIALQKSINANIQELPDYLFQKAKFWGKPQDWLKESSSMELVPKLNYLEEQCESILIRLRKK